MGLVGICDGGFLGFGFFMTLYMLPKGTGRSMGEAGGESRASGDVEDGEGDLRRRFTGRFGNGGLTATGGLGFGRVGGGLGSSLRSRP